MAELSVSSAMITPYHAVCFCFGNELAQPTTLRTCSAICLVFAINGGNDHAITIFQTHTANRCSNKELKRKHGLRNIHYLLDMITTLPKTGS